MSEEDDIYEDADEEIVDRNIPDQEMGDIGAGGDTGTHKKHPPFVHTHSLSYEMVTSSELQSTLITKRTQSEIHTLYSYYFV